VTGVLRVGLRLASVATVLLAGWLATVVLIVLPARDPDHVPLWAVVAIGAAALALLSWLASTRASAPSWPARAGLLVLGLAGVGFGLLVLGSTLSDAVTADPEGYLVVIGGILAAHGILALGWVAAVTIRRDR